MFEFLIIPDRFVMSICQNSLSGSPTAILALVLHAAKTVSDVLFIDFEVENLVEELLEGFEKDLSFLLV